MQRNCCHISLAFLLKFLNFLQAFIGISIILYSIWMLEQWNHHVPVPPSPPSAVPYSDSQSHSLRAISLVTDLANGFDDGLGLRLNSFQLPALWFIYAFMGLGIILCCITLIGCIAAEALNGCCLCFYTVLKIIFILIEAALVAFIAIDRRWEKDIPLDPTGELQNLRSFIEDNIDMCKWIGIAVLVIQALSLLLSMILRSMISTSRKDSECEDDYENGRGRSWEHQSGQTSGSGAHSDIWSQRMREKYGLNSGALQYGLNSGDKSNALIQNASIKSK